MRDDIRPLEARLRVLTSLQAQNAVAPSGVIQAGPEQLTLRVSGHFTSVESLEAVNLRVNDRFFRLSDIATSRGRSAPPSPSADQNA